MPGSRKKTAAAKIVKSKTVFKGPVFSVVSQQVREPDGVNVRRDIVEHPGSIVVLAVDDSTRPPRVLLERQYRHAARTRLWELPAGSLDPGESPLTGARRELLEETGYTASKWQKALYFYVSPGFLTESMEIYLATGLKQGKAQPEEDERIAIRFFPLNQAIAMAESGKIIDAKTIAGLLWLERHLSQT
ncbi:MAG TPA: NUDIX hydrolase [Candidatus Angelobacter sp.]|jgi:ADP-ribose pyrophosphatase|nr:NUDIX hydrolase [Candidatus Angelobacter sp.]